MTPWPPPPPTSPLNFTSSPLLVPRACTLTPAASAFSAILSAVIGSLINGISSGWIVALAMGWIAWLAIFRVLLGAAYMLTRSLSDTWGPPPTSSSSSVEHVPLSHPGPYDDPPPAYNNNPYGFRATRHRQKAETRYMCSGATLWPAPGVVRGAEPPPSAPAHWAANAMLKPRGAAQLDRSVTALGWFSWGYTVVFAPVTQVLFLTSNWSRPGLGAAKLVKGLTVAVTALPLCVDVRVRYGERLNKGWMRVGFNVLTAGSCLVQGVFCAMLLAQGVVEVGKNSGVGRGRGGFPTILMIAVPVYLLFSVIWAVVSCSVLPMRDGGRRDNTWGVFGYVRDLVAGAFAGAFLAMPAVMLYMGVSRGGGGGPDQLSQYLACETQVWRKLAAVLP